MGTMYLSPAGKVPGLGFSFVVAEDPSCATVRVVPSSVTSSVPGAVVVRGKTEPCTVLTVDGLGTLFVLDDTADVASRLEAEGDRAW